MRLSTRLRVLILGLVLAASAQAEPLGPGDVPPPVVGWTREGNKVSVTDYPGKAVIVTFWATWCPYCIKELPILENVQNRAGKDRIVVIAVNTEDIAVFKRASRLMSESMHLTLVHDADDDAQRAYGVKGLPHMVIIRRDGRIQRVWHGYSEDSLGAIADDINKALAAPI